MTALAVLATGNHYVLDVLAGLATCVAMLIVGPVTKYLSVLGGRSAALFATRDARRATSTSTDR